MKKDEPKDEATGEPKQEAKDAVEAASSDIPNMLGRRQQPYRPCVKHGCSRATRCTGCWGPRSFQEADKLRRAREGGPRAKSEAKAKGKAKGKSKAKAKVKAKAKAMP